MKYIFEIIFLAIIFVFSDIQANLINDQKPINHYAWGGAFGGIIIFGVWFESWNLWFLFALLLEHFVFFSPFLNFLRRPRKPFFYVSSVGKNGSLWDKWLIKIQSAYPYIWVVGLIAFALINIFKL